MYDGPSGKELRRWPLPAYRPTTAPPALALSGDGRLLFAGKEGMVGVDVGTGKELVRLPILVPPGHNELLAASADGGRLAVLDRDKVRVYDVASGKMLSEHPTVIGLWRVQFSPDARQVIGWSRQKNLLWVWDVGSDAKPRALDGGYSPPTRTAFNRDGTRLVVGYQDGTSVIWDLAKK